MGLNEKQKQLFEKLSKLAEEPDRPPVGRSVTAHVDLTDPKSIALAIKHGFLDGDDDEDDDDDDGDDDSAKDSAKEKQPNRRGSFFMGDK